MTPRALLAAALAATTLLPAALPAPAAAGTYPVEIDTASRTAGWQFAGDAGFFGCSSGQRPGPCDDADVPRDTPLRVLALGAAAANTDGHWYWVAPATVSIAGGSASVDYRTAAGSTRVYMKSRLRVERFADSPTQHATDQTGSDTWSIPAGNEVVGIFLEATKADTYAQKWNNTIAVPTLRATLRDDTAPSLVLGGELAADAWRNEVRPVCTAVETADAGAGVAAVDLSDAAGADLDGVAFASDGSAQPGREAPAVALCLTPADLADGVHALHVTATDAAGEARTVPLTVKVDAHAPVAVAPAPAGTTTERRPAVSFTVDAGPSGLAALAADLDGVPMAVAGDRASTTPAADLAFGTHTVTWQAVDGAGNRRDGIWTFEVVDDAPPALVDAAPAAGIETEARRPAVGFRLVDDGTGVDPATLRVALDGTEIGLAGTFADGRFAFTPPADLALGVHRVRVAASDRSGNAMAPVEWSFAVVDRTAPVLADVRPDDGSAGADTTPEISVAVTDGDGAGVADADVHLTLDGTPFAVAPLGGGRLGGVPAAPLGFGEHVVVATAVDRAGNAAGPLRWTFTVRDEVAPVVLHRAPEPGSTVVGPAVIGFTVEDAGTGIDPGSLVVTVDGSDVTAFATFAGGVFRYEPGTLAPGVHTVAVTVADRAGNVAGPVAWQFAAADPAQITLRAGGGGTIVAGGRTTVVFTVRRDGDPLAGAEVRVAAKPAGGDWSADRPLIASADGLVRVAVSPTVTTAYRARLAADDDVAASARVEVRRRVTLAASDGSVRHGQPVRLTGRVAPARGAAVRVQLLTRRGWVTVARPAVTRSRFAKVVIPPVAGRYVFRAVTPETGANAAGRSALVTVRAR